MMYSYMAGIKLSRIKYAQLRVGNLILERIIEHELKKGLNSHKYMEEAKFPQRHMKILAYLVDYTRDDVHILPYKITHEILQLDSFN